MKIIGRFFICIWAVLYFVFCMCGGFLLLPIFRYIFIGSFDDPMEVVEEVYIIVKNGIEDFFDNLHKVFNISHINFNGRFWK